MAGYGIPDHTTLSAELSAGTNHPDGVGSVEVQQPRVRDRGSEGEKIRFSPAILPPYARRSTSLDALIPILYLRGISSGDFQDGHPLIVEEAIGSLGVRPILASRWQALANRIDHPSRGLRRR